MDLGILIAKTEWPAVIAGGGYYFREEIRGFLNRINGGKVTVPGVASVEVKAELDDAETLNAVATEPTSPTRAEAINPSPRNEHSDSEERQNAQTPPLFSDGIAGPHPSFHKYPAFLNDPYAYPPEYLILKYWESLEHEIMITGKEAGVLQAATENLLVGPDLVRVLEFLQLPFATVEMVRKMRTIRNIAAHSLGNDLSVADAFRVRDLAANAISQIAMAHRVPR